MDFKHCNEYLVSSSSLSENLNSNSYNSSESKQSPSTVLVSHKKRAGRKKFKETRHPFYRGVRERKNDKWVCEVREPNKKSRIWLGTYPTPEMAARAYDVAALALRGKSAPLNFQDSLWLLPRAKSSSAKDIQMAAAEAFPFPTSSSSSSSSSSTSSSSSSSILAIKSQSSFTSKLSKSVKQTVLESSSSSSSSCTANKFLDEEALFNMPALLASMAEGMLINPPDLQKGFSFDDDVEYNVGFSLWTD